MENKLAKNKFLRILIKDIFLFENFYINIFELLF